VEDDLDATRRAIFLESDDGVHRAGQPRAESRDCNAGAVTKTLGYLRMV
jgi:hypothetical protein